MTLLVFVLAGGGLHVVWVSWVTQHLMGLFLPCRLPGLQSKTLIIFLNKAYMCAEHSDYMQVWGAVYVICLYCSQRASDYTRRVEGAEGCKAKDMKACLHTVE